MARPPNAISSFTNIDLAEKSVSDAIKVNKEWIKIWAASRPGYNLNIKYDTGKAIGYSLFRGVQKLTPATRVKVVLKYELYNGKPYYILTAFPEV